MYRYQLNESKAMYDNMGGGTCNYTAVKTVVCGKNVYTATHEGFCISNDDGNTFVVKTTKNSGLSDDVVFDITPSSAGVLYVATGGGLSISHDGGESFKTFSEKHGLASSHVQSLALGSDKLFIGTEKGLTVRQKDGTFKNINLNNKKVSVYGITVDADNPDTIYLATDKKVFVSRNNGDSFKESVFVGDQGDYFTLTFNVALFGTWVFASAASGLKRSGNCGVNFERIDAIGTGTLEDRYVQSVTIAHELVYLSVGNCVYIKNLDKDGRMSQNHLTLIDSKRTRNSIFSVTACEDKMFINTTMGLVVQHIPVSEIKKRLAGLN